MAVTTIKSAYSLEVESVRAGGVGTSLDGVEVRSVAAGSCLCSVGNPPGSAGVPPASLYLQTACHPRPLPCKAHQTRLYGVLFPRAGLCAGGTPALPGGVCAGETPALPGGLSSRAVMPPPREWSEKSVQCTKSPMKYRPTGNWHKAEASRLTQSDHGQRRR